MIDKKFIKNIMHDLLHDDPTQGDHNLMHPEREWFIGLGVATIILGAGALWCVQIYFTHSDSTKIIPTELQTEQTIYREKEVDQALREFAERKNKHEDLRQKLLNAQNNVPLENNIFIPLSVGTTSTTTLSNSEEETSTTTTHSPSSQSAEVPGLEIF